MTYFNVAAMNQMEHCLHGHLKKSGIGVLTGFLKESARLCLLRELECYRMVQADPENGPRKVKQDFVSFDKFPPESLFLQVRDELCEELRTLFIMGSPCNLTENLQFTHQVVQRYEPGPLGIGAHKDGKSHINLIALLVLEGRDGLHACEDGEGKNSALVPNKAGDLILMRGAGFAGIDQQPYHLVKDITERRTVLAFRQKKVVD